MVKFNPKTHKYDGGKYQPVTAWCSQFHPPFKKKVISKAVGKRDGKDPKKIAEKWTKKGELSTAYGEAIHRTIEYFIRYGEKPDQPHLKKCVEAFEKANTHEDIVPEIVVNNDKLAGTIDQVVRLGNKEVIVRDIKTNGNFNKKAYGKLLKPFQELKNNHLNKYRLQLAVYSYLLKEKGLTVKQQEIWHWDGKAFNPIKVKPLKINKAI